MVHLKKTERVTLVLCAKCQISVMLARGTSGLPFGKKCKQKTVYCCDGHCALGAHQPLGDGHTSARSGEPKRDPISQFPNHRNPQVAIYGGVNAKPSIFMFWMLLQTLPVPIFIFLEPNRWSWRWPLPWEP